MTPTPPPATGHHAMTRMLTNLRFWVLTFLLGWLTTVTVLIANGG
ncbi:hypothetical protein GCM10009634_69980 [Saccharothrix xinjiangensis]